MQSMKSKSGRSYIKFQHFSCKHTHVTNPLKDWRASDRLTWQRFKFEVNIALLTKTIEYDIKIQPGSLFDFIEF